MKELKNKKGISLIVLVITIIVMIILATAIILSLNSSDIIGKANEAKTSSDSANKKAAASVLLAEYELAVVNGETTKTANEYVRDRLVAQGIDASDIAVTDDNVILVGTAALFINNNVQIGDTVIGYTLSQDESAKTYTTSGKENTNDEIPEPSPQPATISRNDDKYEIVWQYMGIDEKGKALIVASVTEKSPTMTLGGKGGFINGPKELKDACKAMYSSSMGTARSIDIDDVIRVLEYTGELGGYADNNGNYIRISKPMTINQIAKEKGYTIIDVETPDGKNIGTYNADSYTIGVTVQANQYNSSNEVAKKLIFIPELGMSSWPKFGKYWLSSTELYYGFDGVIDFCVKAVSHDTVGGEFVYEKLGNRIYSGSPTYVVRPVVELEDNIEVTYSNGVVTLR